jgi:hypothetical protein
MREAQDHTTEDGLAQAKEDDGNFAMDNRTSPLLFPIVPNHHHHIALLSEHSNVHLCISITLASPFSLLVINHHNIGPQE